jgi:cell fate regulator YaaT (PSP1 superfamily)
MPLVVGVRFNPATKVYYFDPSGFQDLEAGEYVVVQTARGQEVGKVIIPPNNVAPDEIVGSLKPVTRRASVVDLSQMVHYQLKEQDARERCQQKVKEHGLPMKIVRAEYNFDGSRLVFFFSSEKRVDFRRLVQDLARTFRARIELRQVGVRDQAKLIGGIGKCGRTLCCVSWLADFDPVSIRMAKQQDLPLSPMEISGVCGRLLCCLVYENQQYVDIKREMPKRGATIDTPRGLGKVTQVNAIKETVRVTLENQSAIEVSMEELADMKELAQQPPHSGKPQQKRRPSQKAGREPQKQRTKPQQQQKSKSKSSRRRRRRRKR